MYNGKLKYSQQTQNCFFSIIKIIISLYIIIIIVMRRVGQKYAHITNQFREMHHTHHMQKIKSIMKTEKSNQHFQRTFPQYPIQYTWNHSGRPLHAYCWEPETQKKAMIVNCNALNSHTGLSGSMAQSLASHGIGMTGIDYPNFGKSHSPDPGHIQSIHDLVDVSQHYLEHVIQKNPGIPIFLNGLSMGGLIAFQVGLRKPSLINGCIFLNPAFKDNPVNNGFLKKVMMLGGMLLPKFQTMKPIRSHSTKHSLQKYKTMDPLMYSGKVWTSTTWALLSNMRRVSKQEKFSQFELPFLCIQGGSDKILNPFTVFELEQCSKSTDKEIVIIPDLWHALWFDDHLDEVTSMIKQWVLDRIDTKVLIKDTQKQIQTKAHPHHGRHVHHQHFGNKEKHETNINQKSSNS